MQNLVAHLNVTPGKVSQKSTYWFVDVLSSSIAAQCTCPCVCVCVAIATTDSYRCGSMLYDYSCTNDCYCTDDYSCTVLKCVTWWSIWCPMVYGASFGGIDIKLWCTKCIEDIIHDEAFTPPIVRTRGRSSPTWHIVGYRIRPIKPNVLLKDVALTKQLICDGETYIRCVKYSSCAGPD